MTQGFLNGWYAKGILGRRTFCVPRGSIAVGLCWLTLATSVAAQEGKGLKPSHQDVSDEHFTLPALPRARVSVRNVHGLWQDVKVEVAADSLSRTRGLMWRKGLEDGAGMLFLFPEEDLQSFWMRNTLIPLDMLFIGKNMRVVGIVRHALPLTLTPRNVNNPSQFVLEVPAGWVDRAGIQEGARVRFEGVSLKSVQP